MPALHPPPPISPTHAVGERGRPSHAQSQPALRVERPWRAAGCTGRKGLCGRSSARQAHAQVNDADGSGCRVATTCHGPPAPTVRASSLCSLPARLDAWRRRRSVQANKTPFPAYLSMLVVPD